MVCTVPLLFNSALISSSQLMCSYLTILMYELIFRQNRGTVNHNMYLPIAWQILNVYASGLIMLTLLEYDAMCETLLFIHHFHPTINFRSILSFCAKKLNNSAESFVLIWRNPLYNQHCSRI